MKKSLIAFLLLLTSISLFASDSLPSETVNQYKSVNDRILRPVVSYKSVNDRILRPVVSYKSVNDRILRPVVSLSF